MEFWHHYPLLCTNQAILPALEHVMLPDIRPVAKHLRSAEETAALEAVVAIMDAYCLSYGAATGAAAAAKAASMQSAHSTHTSALPVQPPVDQLCRYEVGLVSFCCLPCSLL